MTVLVIMGVSGCGKSTIAALLAGRLGWPFAEGDDLHPAANVAKMHAGHPLDDADRLPWLRRIAAWIDDQIATGRSSIITCSALKRSYRDLLRREQVTFVYLHGDRERLAQRLAARQGHFMPAGLLDSQLADLEPPGEDEQSIRLEIGDSPVELADEVVRTLGLTAAG